MWSKENPFQANEKSYFITFLSLHTSKNSNKSKVSWLKMFDEKNPENKETNLAF